MSSADNDVFGYFMSESPVVNNVQPTNTVPSANIQVKQSSQPSSLAQQEQDFFNQVPSDKGNGKMTKDSILALYGAAPPINRMPPPTANNHFMGQAMPGQLSNDFSSLPTQFQQQPAFASNTNNTTNNFAQFGGMMQQGQQTMNFQPTMNNTMPNQGIGAFPVQTNQSLFAQQNVNSLNLGFSSVPAPNTNVNNVNQQFGNLNLGNVWQ